MRSSNRTDVIRVDLDLFGSKESPVMPLYIHILRNSNLAKMLLEDYPQLEKSSECFTLQDNNFTSKDYSLTLVSSYLRQLLVAKDNTKLETLYPNYKIDLHNFISQKTEAHVKQATKIKSKSDFVRFFNILGTDLGELGTLFAELLMEEGEENIKDGLELGLLEVRLIKHVIAALETNSSKSIAQDKTKKITELNVSLADLYLAIGSIYFHDEKRDPLSSLFYFVKADELLAHTHANSTAITHSTRYLSKGFLCSLCIRSGDLEKAAFYAKSFSSHHSYLLKNGKVELAAMDDRLKFNPYTQLADAFLNAGRDDEAVEWYEHAIKMESDVNKQKAIQQNISKIAAKYASLGQEAYKSSNYQVAIPYYAKAIKIEKDVAIKNRYEFIQKMVASKQKEQEDKQKSEIIELAKQFPHIKLRFHDKDKLVIVDSINDESIIGRSYSLLTPLAQLEEVFKKLDSSIAAINIAPEATPSSNSQTQPADSAPDVEPKTDATTSISTTTIVAALEEKDSPSSERSQERKSKKSGKEEKSNDENNNNNNNAPPAAQRVVGHPDEALGYALFGADYPNEKIYPLTSSYIGKTVHFALFRPPTAKGLGATLTQETIDAHRACLEKNVFGPKEGVRLTKTGMKTWISSDSQAGDIRFASEGEVTLKKDGVTYHLVIVDKVYDHKSQKALYKK